MRKYEMLELEIIEFETDDVIQTSPGGDEGGEAGSFNDLYIE